MEISYASAPCSLGHVVVGGTAQGVCALFLGDEPESLVQILQQRFARAHLVRRQLPLHVDVLALLEAPEKPQSIPQILLVGTTFQRRVWAALQTIAAGTTRTYTEVAEQLGNIRAVRAVAAACGANPLAVLIPCHRVIGADGQLHGYRWGVARKRLLLQREGAALQS